MRDVGSQLVEYFEAATERIDAEDVQVRAAVNHQLEELPHHRRLRPAWSAAFGFIGGLALVGGALVAGLLMRNPAVVAPQPLGSPATGPGSRWSWWPLAVAGSAVAVGIIVLVSRRLRRATKEVDMQTTETRVPERTETQRRPRRLGWMVGVIVLAVALIGGGIWAIVEANQPDDIEVATDLIDDWIAGWNASDIEAIVAVFTEDASEHQLLPARWYATSRNNFVLTSDLLATEAAKTYRYTAEFEWSGHAWSGEWEVELEGDLIGRMDEIGSFTILHPIDE